MASYRFTDAVNKPSHEEPGDHLVKLIKFEFKLSQNSGNEMIELQLQTESGVVVYDNLVFTDKAFWKIDTALKCLMPSLGKTLPDKDEDIDIDEEWVNENLLGASGMVSLGIEQKKDKPGQYRNTVLNYLAPGEGKAAAAKAAAAKPGAPKTGAPVSKPAATPAKPVAKEKGPF